MNTVLSIRSLCYNRLTTTEEATLRLRLRVKEIAEARGMSMGKLERLADLSHPTIRDIYRDPYKEVTSTTLAKLATALNVSVSDLFVEESDKQ